MAWLLKTTKIQPIISHHNRSKATSIIIDDEDCRSLINGEGSCVLIRTVTQLVSRRAVCAFLIQLHPLRHTRWIVIIRLVLSHSHFRHFSLPSTAMKMATMGPDIAISGASSGISSNSDQGQWPSPLEKGVVLYQLLQLPWNILSRRL